MGGAHPCPGKLSTLAAAVGPRQAVAYLLAWRNALHRCQGKRAYTLQQRSTRAPLSLNSLSREREVKELWHRARSSALSATTPPPHVSIAPLSCSPALLRCFMLLNYTLVALPEASIEVEVPVPTPPKTAFNLGPTTGVLLACRLHNFFNSAFRRLYLLAIQRILKPLRP
jgi:hypothetical protein